MEIFAYADESQFKKNQTDINSVTGSGILISPKPISQDVIEEALQNLNQDIGRSRSDDKTLLKKHFHATEDGPRAHFHFIQTINKYVSGRYRYSTFENHLETTSFQKRNSEQLFKLTLGLASNDFFSHRYSKINLVVEERSKFTKPMAEKWLESWFGQYDLHAYSQTSFITYYPEIEIVIGNKSVPGLQVVDLLLWAFNRTRREVPDNKWKEMLKMSTFSHYSTENGPQSGGDCSLGTGLPLTGLLMYPVKVNDPNREEFYECYLIIERTIRLLAKAIPNKIIHLKPKFDSILQKLSSPNLVFGEKILFEIASLFIRVFDTLPVYEDLKDSDTEKWDLLLKAKRMAGLYLRRDLIHGVRSADGIIRWRHEILKTHPTIFE
jgi:hypothetical protein